MSTIGVIGAGAWGTALAQAYASDDRKITIWARENEVVEAINKQHENTLFLPGIVLSNSLEATNSIDEVVKNDILLLVTPAQYLRAQLEAIVDKISSNTILVICSKGIEISTGKFLSQIAQEITPKNEVAILTGPTFASDIGRGLPAAVTIGAYSPSTGQVLQEQLATQAIRPYLSDDLIGVQLGGALKNVLAIAAGMVEGKQLGESARAALITRGIAEMARLGTALGANPETLLGMCGIGDLMLTANSMQSRNFSMGAALGEGKTLEEILKTRSSVTEGVHTARAVIEIAQKHGVDMPVSKAVYDILEGNVTIDEAMDNLLDRPLKTEKIKKHAPS